MDDFRKNSHATGRSNEEIKKRIDKLRILPVTRRRLNRKSDSDRERKCWLGWFYHLKKKCSCYLFSCLKVLVLAPQRREEYVINTQTLYYLL